MTDQPRPVASCDCPVTVHHRHDCDQRPRVPTHVFKPHRRWPWFCGLCGYPPHETLKHHPAPTAEAKAPQ